MTMYLKPKLDATAPKAAPKGRRKNKQQKQQGEKKAFGKTFAISARGKTRAKLQREHAMGTLMMRATCQMRCMPHNGSSSAPHRTTPRCPRRQSCTDDKQHPLPLSRERESEKERGRERESGRNIDGSKECLLYPVEVKH